jgi:hypothetical protein
MCYLECHKARYWGLCSSYYLSTIYQSQLNPMSDCSQMTACCFDQYEIIGTHRCCRTTSTQWKNGRIDGRWPSIIVRRAKAPVPCLVALQIAHQWWSIYGPLVVLLAFDGLGSLGSIKRCYSGLLQWRTDSRRRRQTIQWRTDSRRQTMQWRADSRRHTIHWRTDIRRQTMQWRLTAEDEDKQYNEELTAEDVYYTSSTIM